MRIINLTQHVATPEQIAAGVVEPGPEFKEAIKELLTFDELPTRTEINSRAFDLADLASIIELSREDDGEVYANAAMIGGAPFFMSALESALMDYNIQPLYAFSVRQSEDQVMADGSVKKMAVFKHIGFV